MKDFEDRKNLRRDNLKQKKCKSSRVETDANDLKRKTKSFKHKKQQNYEDEQWEQWQSQYR